ncbi:unnamed protein product [Trichobilharzia regenti]|nr:unnamed protein product [Trichobilharzia regenti]
MSYTNIKNSTHSLLFNYSATLALHVQNFTDPKVFGLSSCIIITLMFALIVVFSIFGNILVMWIILNNRRMRTVTNCFLFNLSAADLLTVFQIVPNVYYVLHNDWIFGVAYCKFSQFFTAFNIAISVFTFIAIASDR